MVDFQDVFHLFMDRCLGMSEESCIIGITTDIEVR